MNKLIFKSQGNKSVRKDNLEDTVSYEGLSISPEVSVSKLDLFSLLSEADRLEDESINFYTLVKAQKAEWAQVLDDIIQEELNHRGQIQALRATIDSEVATALDEGQREAADQLQNSDDDIEPGLQEALDDDFENSYWDDEIADELELEDESDLKPMEIEEDEIDKEEEEE